MKPLLIILLYFVAGCTFGYSINKLLKKKHIVFLTCAVISIIIIYISYQCSNFYVSRVIHGLANAIVAGTLYFTERKRT